MAEAFILNPDNLRTVNHKDGNKLNNTLDNLEWASDEWQQRHAFKLNLKQKVGRYISDEEVFHIYKLYYEQHISPKKISEMLNMPFGTIRKICYQERCKDLFEKYRANLLIKIDKQCNA